MNIRCWWDGHEPDYSSQAFDGDPNDYGWHTPCKRCGLWDIEYHELVEDTRKQKLINWCRFWFFRKWWPIKCGICGRRWKKCPENDEHFCDSIPF